MDWERVVNERKGERFDHFRAAAVTLWLHRTVMALNGGKQTFPLHSGNELK